MASMADLKLRFASANNKPVAVTANDINDLFDSYPAP